MIHVDKRAKRISRIYPFDQGANFTVKYDEPTKAKRVSLYISVRNCRDYWFKQTGEFWDVIADSKAKLIYCSKVINNTPESKYISD